MSLSLNFCTDPLPRGASSYTFGWRGIDYGKRGFLFFASQSRSSVGVANPPPKYLETVEEVVPLFRNVSPLSVFPNGSLRDWAPPSIPLWLKKDTPPPSPDMKRGKSRTKLVSNSERVVNTHPHWVSQLPKTGRPTDERDFDFDTI